MILTTNDNQDHYRLRAPQVARTIAAEQPSYATLIQRGAAQTKRIRSYTLHDRLLRLQKAKTIQLRGAYHCK